jgi:hypothetical protein
MKLTFCNGWFRAKKRPGELWTEKQAKDAFDNRRLHTVVISHDDKPAAFIEFNGDYVGVGFLDHAIREYLSYTFNEVSPGKLFLTQATHREYEGETDRVKSGTSYYFKQDGAVAVKREDFTWTEGQSSPVGVVSTKDSQVDVSGHWETYPKFGEYDALLRVERS